MNRPWLTVIGCLPDGSLAPGAPAEALEAPAVFGPERLLSAASVPCHRRRPWPRPFREGLAALIARRGEPTTVLASGDPMHFGVGGTLARSLPAHEMDVYPAPSAFALAAGRLAWPLEDVRCASLHRSCAEDVLAHAADGRKLLLLTRDGAQPAEIAKVLTRAGFGDSPVTVLEALGSIGTSVHSCVARSVEGVFDALNVVAIACVAGPPVTAHRLEHDGCITRDAVRAMTVDALAGGRHLWDVGAGSGSVAIAWCRGGGTATLFERVGERAAAARRNIATHEAAATVLSGEAMDNVAAADPPDRVFFGGGITDDALFEAVWPRLADGGVLVANAVTLEGEVALTRRHRAYGGTLTRIALSFAGKVGDFTVMRPALPVTQWRVTR